MPYAGHLSPQNPHCLSHPQAHDYSKTVVTTLILDNELAPFYRGLDDFEEEWTEDDIRTALEQAREKDYAADVQNSFTQRLKEVRVGGKELGPPLDVAERERREAKAYLGAVECPICFLVSRRRMCFRGPSLTHRTIPRTSTRRAAASSPCAQNALCRSSAQMRRTRILRVSRRAVPTVSSRSLASSTSALHRLPRQSTSFPFRSTPLAHLPRRR